jgi:hypothetical protein
MRTLATPLLLAAAVLAATAPHAAAGGIVGDGPLLPNDDQAGALPLTGFSTTPGTNVGASRLLTEPLCASDESSTVWYAYTVAPGGQAFTARVQGLGFQAVLGVYADGTLLSCSASGEAASVWAAEGARLYLQVGGRFGAQGAFLLDLVPQGSDAPLACLEYNPAALTNVCLTMGSSVTPVPTPQVSTTPTPLCIVGPVCVPVPVPAVTVGSTPVTAPDPNGYVEATVLCGVAPGACRVTL